MTHGQPEKTIQLPIQLSFGWARATRTIMANITAHALLSGDGEKMKICHPTNDDHPSSTPEKRCQLPTHFSHEKQTYHFHHLDGHEGLGRACPTLPLMCY